MPSAEGRGPVLLREARVLDVDPVKYTCRIQFVRGEEPADVVASMYPYLSNSTGGWMGAVPEVGDFVLAATPLNSSSYVILGHYALPETGDPDATVGEAVRDNFSNGRPPATPGDMGMYGGAGNFVQVSRDGVLTLAADEVTYTRFFRDTHAIQTFCFSHAVQGLFGSSEWYTHREETREAAEDTPTGYSAWVKTHAEAAPNINVEMGAVRDEEELRLPGAATPDNQRRGTVAVRLLVFDQQTANLYRTRGSYPDPNRARFAVRVDEAGNVVWQQTGALTQVVDNLVQHALGRWVAHVGGAHDAVVEGDSTHESKQRLRLVGQRAVDVVTTGPLTLQYGQLVMTGDNDRIKLRRNFEVDANGRIHLDGAGGLRLTTAGEGTLTVGRGFGQSVGGRWTADVLNSLEPRNAAVDAVGTLLRLKQGKMRLQSVAGSLELVLGPEDAPLARIKMHADPRAPAQLGRIEIGFPLTQSGLTLSPDGAWELTGAVGGVKADAAGRVQLGNKFSPAVGNVVTTLSHPVCYVTGLPILGSADVVVSAGPVAPFAGAPAVGVLPPTVSLPDVPPVE